MFFLYLSWNGHVGMLFVRTIQFLFPNVVRYNRQKHVAKRTSRMILYRFTMLFSSSLQFAAIQRRVDKQTCSFSNVSNKSRTTWNGICFLPRWTQYKRVRKTGATSVQEVRPLPWSEFLRCPVENVGWWFQAVTGLSNEGNSVLLSGAAMWFDLTANVGLNLKIQNSEQLCALGLVSLERRSCRPGAQRRGICALEFWPSSRGPRGSTPRVSLDMCMARLLTQIHNWFAPHLFVDKCKWRRRWRRCRKETLWAAELRKIEESVGQHVSNTRLDCDIFHVSPGPIQ